MGEIAYILPSVRSGEEILSLTMSVCPYCYKVLPATIFEKSGRVYIKRICPEHGLIEEVYYSDVEFYKKVTTFQDEGRGPRHIYTPIKTVCPFNCGLCGMHKQHSALINLVVTNRCDLSCWYCFFYAEASGYLYEPTIDQIRNMIRSVKKQGVTVAVQLTGGEPLLREDLVEIVRLLRDEGVRHIQLNTNGIKIAEMFIRNPAEAVEFAKNLRASGLNTVYLSFDGVTPRTNWKNHWEVPYIFEVFRRSGVTSVVLVPTVIRGINTDELGAIVKFAAKHIDIVRSVNFQPISLTGLMKKHEREKHRITIPEIVKLIEEQTDGEISRDSWFPVNASVMFSRFIEGFSGEFKFEMANHPVCGVGTYVYVDKSEDRVKLIPITKFIDIEGLLEYLRDKWRDLISGSSRILTGLRLLYSIRKFIDQEKAPREVDVFKILINIVLKRSYNALGELHYKLLFIGQMHFMDLYNYDIQRVQRCNIHYVVPDGRLIPFCAFNIFEEIYRDKIHREFSTQITKPTKKYTRDRKLLESSEIYKKTYEGVLELVVRK